MKIKLLIACRQPGLASSLFTTILLAADGQITAEVTDISGALARAATMEADVLLLEHTGDDDESAWEVVAQLESAGADTRVLLLGDANAPLDVMAFIQRGASGLILKSSEPSLFAKAVAAVNAGEPWFGRTAVWHALRSQITGGSVASTLPSDQKLLTAREREILGLVGYALTNKEIGRQLNISHKTVMTHLHNIYAKLHKSGRYKVILSNLPAATAPALRSRPHSRLQ